MIQLRHEEIMAEVWAQLDRTFMSDRLRTKTVSVGYSRSLRYGVKYQTEGYQIETIVTDGKLS